MSESYADIRTREAMLDLVQLRRPVAEAADALIPYFLRDYQGPPLVRLDRAALHKAITAHRAGVVTTRDLRDWALLVHLEITDPPGRRGRDAFLGWEPRARLLLNHQLDALAEAGGDDGVTEALLDRIERDLEYTDWTWLTRTPWAAAACEFTAVAAWTFLVAWLLAPRLADPLAGTSIGAFGAMAVGICAARLLRGPDTAIARFQRYLPAALLGAAVIGARYALGDTQ